MPTRTPTSKRTSTARFSRPATSAGRRQAAPARRQVRVTRRKPDPKGTEKMMKALGGMMPGAATAKGRRASGGGRGKKGAGLALLAGAAGLAMKNRGKLSSMLPGRRSDAPPLQPKMPETPPNVQSTADQTTSAPIADTDRPPT